jgi:acetate kinase
MASTASPVLALNSGSSSLKFGVFIQQDSDARATYRGSIDGIGGKEGRLQIRSADGASLINESHPSGTQADAIRAAAKYLVSLNLPPLAGIGHRIVHGGPSLREHQRLTPEVLQKLEAAASFAPLHVPVALSLIRETQSQYPGVPQIVCFDTAFHRTLPEVASRFPLPQEFWDSGIQRYGFHGISCESILHALGKDLPARAAIAHLGNGASITAVADGRSVDTSMGLTPTGGIIMGTRTGDLDPGILLHLRRNTNLEADRLEKLLDKQSGLLGISGFSSDMRELHQASGNPHAQLAVEMFARTAAKTIASYAAVLGGLDLIVFSGGIGEHDSIVRGKICESLAFLGLSLDPDRNAQNRPVISRPDSRVSVRIVPADEETQIARHIFRLLA